MLIRRRWHGLLPAALALALLASLWAGASASLRGRQQQESSELDRAFPLVAALKDGARLADAERIAQSFAAMPGVAGARVVGPEALENLLPQDEPWAREIASQDLRYVPPSLQVVVEEGVRDPSVRARIRQALTGVAETEFVWPDGPDLTEARRRLEDGESFAGRLGWLSMIAVTAIWLAFLLIDLRHFAYLVGREQAIDLRRETLALQGARALLLRGLLIGGIAALAACAGLLTVALVLGAAPAAGSLAAQCARAIAYSLLASVIGHGAVGALLWGHSGSSQRLSVEA